MATDLDPAGIELHKIQEAADLRGRRVLEIGAADGRLTFQYARTAKWVVGIDPKEIEIKAAAGACRTKRLTNVQFVCTSGTALPFPALGFDTVLFSSSL
jgi:ubiquinone/menaquinone biosynthesis C-methylase UbiE